MAFKLGSVTDSLGSASAIDNGNRVTGIDSDTNPVRGGQESTGPSESNAGIDGLETIDPTSIFAAGTVIGGSTDRDTSTAPRKRGRPFGSRNRPTAIDTEKAEPRNTVDLAGLLVSAHGFLAAIIGAKEIAIDPSEGKAMADALREMEKYYPIAVPGKYVAIANLIGVAGMVYLPRVKLYNDRVKKERGEKLHVLPSQPKDTQTAPAQKVNGFAHPAKTADKLTPNDLWAEPASEDGHLT